MNASLTVANMTGRHSMESEFEFQKSEKQSASGTQARMRTDAEITADAQQLVRKAAEPAAVCERICAQMWRAAQRLDLSYSKTKAYWYGERRRIAASEYENLKARVDAINARAEAVKELRDDVATARVRARAAVGRNLGAGSGDFPPLGKGSPVAV